MIKKLWNSLKRKDSLHHIKRNPSMEYIIEMIIYRDYYNYQIEHALK